MRSKQAGEGSKWGRLRRDSIQLGKNLKGQAASCCWALSRLLVEWIRNRAKQMGLGSLFIYIQMVELGLGQRVRKLKIGKESIL